MRVVYCDAVLYQADGRRDGSQSPKSGTNTSRTSVSIRCARDMETTYIYEMSCLVGRGRKGCISTGSWWAEWREPRVLLDLYTELDTRG